VRNDKSVFMCFFVVVHLQKKTVCVFSNEKKGIKDGNLIELKAYF